MNTARDKPPVSRDLVLPIFRNAGFLLLARFVTVAARLIFVLIVARELGSKNYGNYVYVQTWCLLFLPFINFGSQAVMSRSFGQGLQTGIQVAGNLLGFRIVLVPLVVGICFLAGWAIESNDDVQVFLAAACFGLMARGVATWAIQFFTANETNEKILLLNFIFRPLEVIAAIIVLASGGGIVSLLLSYAAVWWLQAGISFLWIKRTHPSVKPNWNLRANIGLAGNSGGSLIVSLAAAWFLQAPLAIGRHILEATTFGQFALAMQLIHVCALIPSTLGIAAVPALSRSFANKGNLDRHFFFIAGSLSFIAITAFAGLTYAFGDIVVAHLFGEAYALVVGFLAVGLAVYLAPNSIARLLSSAVMARGYFRQSSFAAATAICTGVSLALIQPADWGTTGLFLAFGGGNVVWIVLLLPSLASKNTEDTERRTDDAPNG